MKTIRPCLRWDKVDVIFLGENCSLCPNKWPMWGVASKKASCINTLPVLVFWSPQSFPSSTYQVPKLHLVQLSQTVYANLMAKTDFQSFSTFNLRCRFLDAKSTWGDWQDSAMSYPSAKIMMSATSIARLANYQPSWTWFLENTRQIKGRPEREITQRLCGAPIVTYRRT